MRQFTKRIFTPIIVFAVLIAVGLNGQPAGTDTETPATGAANNKKGVLLKNLARITGVRTNQLLGYGLVVGLSGTGDTRSRLASKSIQNLLGGLGQSALANARNRANNVAAVLVTAEVPPFARVGDRITVTVSSIGDARSLEGGVLIQTPLYAGNKQIFAVAQGALSTGGGSLRGSRRKSQTVAQVLNGAIMERAVDTDLKEKSDDPARTGYRVRISLQHFDFSTLQRVREKLQAEMKKARVTLQGGSLIVTLPEHSDPVSYIARMEQIRIVPDYRARVIINERSGTVVMGGDVRVDPVAISRRIFSA